MDCKIGSARKCWEEAERGVGHDGISKESYLDLPALSPVVFLGSHSTSPECFVEG